MAPSEESAEPTVSDARLEPSWRSRRGVLEFDRLSFFTDAVFAIAMWILAIPLGRLVEWLAPAGAWAYIEIFRPETTASTPE